MSTHTARTVTARTVTARTVTDQTITFHLNLVTDQAAELGDQAAEDQAVTASHLEELRQPQWLFWGRFPHPTVTAPSASRLLTSLPLRDALARGLELPLPINDPAEAADTLWLGLYSGTELEAHSLYEELSSALSYGHLEQYLPPHEGQIEIVELEDEVVELEAHDEDPHDPDPCPPAPAAGRGGALSRREALGAGLTLLGGGVILGGLHLVAREAKGQGITEGVIKARSRSPQESHQEHGGTTLQVREAIPQEHGGATLQGQEGGQEKHEEEDLEVTAEETPVTTSPVSSSTIPAELPEPARAIWHVWGIGEGLSPELLWPWIYGEVLHASSPGGRSGGWDLWLAEPEEPGRRYPERLRELPGWIGSQRRMGARLEEGLEEMERDILLGRGMAEWRRGEDRGEGQTSRGQALRGSHKGDRLEGKGVER